MKPTVAPTPTVDESVAALNRSSGLTATHHASSEQGVSPPLLAELVTTLSEHQPPPTNSAERAETQRADELSQPGVHVLTLRGEGDKLLAFAAYYEHANYHRTGCNIVWLQELWVEPESRRTKLGTGLVRAAEPRVQKSHSHSEGGGGEASTRAQLSLHIAP